MEIHVNGYIVRIIDIKENDQILLLLNEERVYNLYANGTRKKESKNSKFIKLGSFIECSIFLSPDVKKLSKLKKIENFKKIEYDTY
jgi:recombinational DNA repair protein (RecF pathway)